MQLNIIVALLAVFLGIALTTLSVADVHNVPEVTAAADPGYANVEPPASRAPRKPATNR